MGLLDRFLNGERVQDDALPARRIGERDDDAAPTTEGIDAGAPIVHDNNTGHLAALRGILRAGRMASVFVLPVVFVAGFIAWLAVSAMAVYHLGAFHFGLTSPTPEFTAGAVTLAAVVLAAYLGATHKLGKQVARSVALMAFIAWLAILALLALLDMGLTSGALRFSSQATANAWRINIPPELLEVSKFVYALVAALPLIVGLILWAVHSSEQPGKYETLSHGAKASGAFFLKLALAVAMFAFEAFFGLRVGYSPVMAIPAALLNAVMFTVAINEVIAAVSDHRPAKLWGAIALLYAGLMFCIAYEVGLAFGGEAFSYAPKPGLLRSIAETGFLSSIGLSAVVLVITKIAPAFSRSEPAAQDDTVTVKQPPTPLSTRAANAIRSGRAGVAEIRGAWNEGRPHRLPAPTLAKDAPTPAQADTSDVASAQVSAQAGAPATMQDDDSAGDGVPRRFKSARRRA